MKRRWAAPGIRCGSCDEELDVEDDTDCIVFCDECHDKVEKVKESEEVFWFTSHLDPRHVMRTSHPALVPLSCLPLSRLPRTAGCDVATAAPAIAAKLAKARRVLIVAGAGDTAEKFVQDVVDTQPANFRPSGSTEKDKYFLDQNMFYW